MALPLQVKAVSFILLLVGHEAVRVRDALKKLSSKNSDGLDPAAEWQQENAACSWSTGNWACLGPGAAVGNCAFRYLPNDGLPPFSSESCRLKDDYMLETNRAKYFQLQAKLLKVKSEKFSKKCSSAGVLHFKCTRRAKHVFRAMSFMTKAQDESLMASLTETQKQEDRALFQESLNHMTSFAGQDAKYVQMLKEKMIANGDAVKRNPLESIAEVVKLLTELLQGSTEEKAAARRAIQDLSPGVADGEEVDASELKQTLESQSAAIKDGLASELEKLDDESHESAEVLQTLETSGNSSTALLEKSNTGLLIEGETIVRGVAFVVIVGLVVAAIVWTVLEILAAIVAWAVLSIIGCGAYAAGHNSAITKNELPADKKMGVFTTMKCIAKVFTVPFVAVYKAGKAISDAFKQEELPPP